MKNYSTTLNLPKTDFSMRANLSEKEPKLLKRWEEDKVYDQSLDRAEEFILHDGPPYANGDIHVGTAFNKILKDIVLKYKRMKGYKARFIPGWDTHGLPIELAVTKEHEGDKLELRRKFRNHALKYIERHKKDFKRIGVLAEWDNLYATLHPKFESNQLKVFSNLVKNNFIYNALKPVFWCTTTRTALAEAEIVYKDKVSDSIYISFKASETLEEELNIDNLYFAVWTTTPWTLPANLGISLHPDLEYVVVKSNDKNLIIAEALIDSLKDKLKLDNNILYKFKGNKLENYEYYHPFIDRKGKVILGNHVAADSGTGCVHTAPGHGADDFIVGNRYNLGILCPVDEKGIMTDEAGPLKGMFYQDSNLKVMELLKDSLLVHEKINHSYPHSERGKTPIIFRATKQWFIDVNSGLREKCLEEIDKISFFPNEGSKRLRAMIENRPDWCISRQRIWGVPIPVFYCNECDKSILDYKLIDEIADEVGEKGSTILVSENAEHFLKGRYECCGKKDFKVGSDIFDVWFDSGTTYATVLGDKIADIYLEGSDQHRGWFQTSLLTSVGSKAKAPYKSLITHGFVVDGNGLKMSKSIGNVILPQEVVNKYGADILRLWVSSVDFAGDVRISDDILKQNSEIYRKIRNTFRFILGNIHDLQDEGELLKIDSLALVRLDILVKKVDKLFSEYQFHNGLTEIVNFVTEMSSFYFDIVKDRLYTYEKNSRERVSAQTTLKRIAIDLCKLLSSILSFTSEEVWSYFSNNSVLLESWPITDSNKGTESWDMLLELRDKVNARIEKLITNNEISKSEEALVKLDSNLDGFTDIELREIFKVAKVILTKADRENIIVEKFDGEKCERCWLYFDKLQGDICNKCSKVVKT